MKWVGKSDIKVWMGEKESYQGNKEEWMDGVHYVKRLVRLINLCTASTISMFVSKQGTMKQIMVSIFQNITIYTQISF